MGKMKLHALCFYVILCCIYYIHDKVQVLFLHNTCHITHTTQHMSHHTPPITQHKINIFVPF